MPSSKQPDIKQFMFIHSKLFLWLNKSRLASWFIRHNYLFYQISEKFLVGLTITFHIDSQAEQLISARTFSADDVSVNDDENSIRWHRSVIQSNASWGPCFIASGWLLGKRIDRHIQHRIISLIVHKLHVSLSRIAGNSLLHYLILTQRTWAYRVVVLMRAANWHCLARVQVRVQMSLT